MTVANWPVSRRWNCLTLLSVSRINATDMFSHLVMIIVMKCEQYWVEFCDDVDNWGSMMAIIVGICHVKIVWACVSSNRPCSMKRDNRELISIIFYGNLLEAFVSCQVIGCVSEWLKCVVDEYTTDMQLNNYCWLIGEVVCEWSG